MYFKHSPNGTFNINEFIQEIEFSGNPATILINGIPSQLDSIRQKWNWKIESLI